MKIPLPFDEETPVVTFEPIQRYRDKRLTPARGMAWACEGKATYASERAARAVARKRSERAGNRISAYRCPFCGEMHIGNVARFD